MAWSFDSKSPVSFQIANAIRLDILTGKYKPGEQFPTVRQLACDASVNPNTVQKSLSILEGEGLLITQSTSGRFVTNDTDVINKALLKMQGEYIKKVISDGIALGITKEKFIEILSKGDEDK